MSKIVRRQGHIEYTYTPSHGLSIRCLACLATKYITGVTSEELADVVSVIVSQHRCEKVKRG